MHNRKRAVFADTVLMCVDPHFVRFNGSRFDCQHVGNVTLYQAPGISIVAQQEQWYPGGVPAVNTRFVVSYSKGVLGFVISGSGRQLEIAGGAPVSWVEAASQSLAGGLVRASLQSNGNYLLLDFPELPLTLAVWSGYSRKSYQNLVIRVPVIDGANGLCVDAVCPSAGVLVPPNPNATLVPTPVAENLCLQVCKLQPGTFEYVNCVIDLGQLDNVTAIVGEVDPVYAIADGYCHIVQIINETGPGCSRSSLPFNASACRPTLASLFLLSF